MYCTNYGSFDYGQGNSEQLLETPSRYAKGAPVRKQSLLSPVESSLTFAPSPYFFKLSTHLSLLPIL
jgi:hypothetical protein